MQAAHQSAFRGSQKSEGSIACSSAPLAAQDKLQRKVRDQAIKLQEQSQDLIWASEFARLCEEHVRAIDPSTDILAKGSRIRTASPSRTALRVDKNPPHVISMIARHRQQMTLLVNQSCKLERRAEIAEQRAVEAQTSNVELRRALDKQAKELSVAHVRSTKLQLAASESEAQIVKQADTIRRLEYALDCSDAGQAALATASSSMQLQQLESQVASKERELTDARKALAAANPALGPAALHSDMPLAALIALHTDRPASLAKSSAVCRAPVPPSPAAAQAGLHTSADSGCGAPQAQGACGQSALRLRLERAEVAAVESQVQVHSLEQRVEALTQEKEALLDFVMEQEQTASQRKDCARVAQSDCAVQTATASAAACAHAAVQVGPATATAPQGWPRSSSGRASADEAANAAQLAAVLRLALQLHGGVAELHRGGGAHVAASTSDRDDSLIKQIHKQLASAISMVERVKSRLGLMNDRSVSGPAKRQIEELQAEVTRLTALLQHPRASTGQQTESAGPGGCAEDAPVFAALQAETTELRRRLRDCEAASACAQQQQREAEQSLGRARAAEASASNVARQLAEERAALEAARQDAASAQQAVEAAADQMRGLRSALARVLGHAEVESGSGSDDALVELVCLALAQAAQVQRGMHALVGDACIGDHSSSNERDVGLRRAPDSDLLDAIRAEVLAGRDLRTELQRVIDAHREDESGGEVRPDGALLQAVQAALQDRNRLRGKCRTMIVRVEGLVAEVGRLQGQLPAEDPAGEVAALSREVRALCEDKAGLTQQLAVAESSQADFKLQVCELRRKWQDANAETAAATQAAKQVLCRAEEEHAELQSQHEQLQATCSQLRSALAAAKNTKSQLEQAESDKQSLRLQLYKLRATAVEGSPRKGTAAVSRARAPAKDTKSPSSPPILDQTQDPQHPAPKPRSLIKQPSLISQRLIDARSRYAKSRQASRSGS